MKPSGESHQETDPTSFLDDRLLDSSGARAAHVVHAVIGLQLSDKELVVKGEQLFQGNIKLLRTVIGVDQDGAFGDVVQSAAIAMLENLNQLVGFEIAELKTNNQCTHETIEG